MNTKLLVLGSTGLIGHQVYNFLKASSEFEMFNISFKNKLQDDSILLDVRDEYSLVNCIEDIAPNYIINCVGVLINGSEKDPENAIFLNAYLPHRLLSICNHINAKLVHISTDCVFSGEKGSAYTEADEKDGIGIYANTKSLGEIINDKHLTLRTSVVGPELRSNGDELFHWFMNQSDTIQGFTKAIWSGVTTIELAKAIKWFIEHNITGLYHITNNSSICKYDLLELLNKYSKRNINIIPVEGPVLDKSFIDTRLLIDYKIPSYDQMIFDMFDFISNNQALYCHYKTGDLNEQ